MREVDSRLIRAFADGELTAAEAERVRSYVEAHPEAAARVEFERRLKEAVKSSMSRLPAAPPALGEAIRRAIEAEGAEEAVAVQSQSEHDVGVSLEPAAAARGTGFLAAIDAIISKVTRPRPVSIGAVIGVFIIVGAAVLFGIFGPQLHTVQPSPNAGLVSDPAEYVSQEHDRCAQDPEVLQRKVTEFSLLEAVHALREHFGVDNVTVFDLSELGYEFVGQGRCGVPGAERSAHLVYERRIEGMGRAKLSIFVATADADLPPKSCRGQRLRPGEWETASGGPRCRKTILQSTDSSLVYYLVCCDRRDAGPVAEHIGRTLLAKSQ